MYSDDGSFEICDYDDDECLPKPILPVADLSSCDLSRPPANGAEYLRRVQLEASKYPDIVTADVTVFEKEFDHDHFSLYEENFIPASEGILPTVEWQSFVVSRFADVRESIAKMRTQSKSSDDKAKYSLAKTNSLEMWRKTIIGVKDVNSDDKNQADESDEEDETYPKLVSKADSGLLPRLSVMMLLSQSLIVDILEGLIDWIKEEGFSHRIGCWTYSLLACIEEPLQPDYVDILRRISRILSGIRSKHDKIEDKTLITSLNLIICLIGKYFNQKDLSDL